MLKGLEVGPAYGFRDKLGNEHIALGGHPVVALEAGSHLLNELLLVRREAHLSGLVEHRLDRFKGQELGLLQFLDFLQMF